MHPVVEVEVAFGPDEHPVDGKATPDAEGDVAVGEYLKVVFQLNYRGSLRF